MKYWGGKITEYDPQAESKAKLEAAKEQAKLIVEATNLKGVELLQVGIALFGYSALKHKQNDTMDELQLEVIQYASEEPEKFEEVLKDKEDDHHKWIMDYLSEGDYKFMYPAVEQNTEKFDTYITPFKQTVDREIVTTQMLYAIYELAISEKDYMTASWLYEKLIKEQIEEENTSRMAVTIMEEESNIYRKADKVLDLLEK